MTNKILDAAREAGQYADAEYRRAWEEASDGASWQQNRDARFYAIARNQALEDAAKLAEEWKTDWAHSLDVAEKIRELKAKL